MRQFSGAASYVWVCSGGGVGGATWEYRQLVCSGILFVVMCAGLKCLQMDRALWKRCTLWEWEKFGPEGDSGEMLGGARGGKDSFEWCFENVRWLGLNERFWLKKSIKINKKRLNATSQLQVSASRHGKSLPREGIFHSSEQTSPSPKRGNDWNLKWWVLSTTELLEQNLKWENTIIISAYIIVPLVSVCVPSRTGA